MSDSVLEALLGPLEESEAPGLDTVDPRFIEIMDLVARQDYILVGERVRVLVQGGVYDIRLIAQYMFSVFEMRGVESLNEVFQCLLHLLESGLESIGPVRRRQQHVAKSAGWLCQILCERMAYHASKKDALWLDWQDLDAESLGETLSTLDDLGERLAAPCFGDCAQLVGHVTRWVRELHEGAVQVAELVASREVAGSDGTSAVIGGSVVPGPGEGRPLSIPPLVAPVQAQVLPTALHGSSCPPPALQPITLRGSHALHDLLQKLNAFETLIRAGKFDRAALLSDDLHEVMDNFDPRLYFPDLFSTFGRLLTENITALEQQWQYRDTTMWKAMRQFSQVDLPGFVEPERGDGSFGNR